MEYAADYPDLYDLDYVTYPSGRGLSPAPH
jgi:hypothetical protein